MKIPRQPQVVTVTISCPHEGDAADARDLLVNFLGKQFDQIQCWRAKDTEPSLRKSYIIMCYPRAVND